MSKRISSVLVVILFLQIYSNIASYQETSLGELTEPNLVQTSTESWEYMELPNVSIISGPGAGSKLMILNSLVVENDGIYFVIAQHGTPEGRYSGPWKIQLGTVLLDWRSFTSSDVDSFYALVKLGSDGQWKWGKMFEGDNCGCELFRWSPTEIAITNRVLYFEQRPQNSIVANLVVFSDSGELLREYETAQGYLGSDGFSHYFTGILRNVDQQWTLEYWGINIDTCTQDVPENYVIGLIFSVDQNFTTNVMLSVVGVSFDANLNDNELAFSFSSSNSWDSPTTIYPSGECDQSTPVSISSSILSSFTGADANPNRALPVVHGMIDLSTGQLHPTAIFPTHEGCESFSKFRNRILGVNSCGLTPSNGIWNFFRYVQLDQSWTPSSPVHIVFDNEWGDPVVQGRGLILNFSSTNENDYQFIPPEHSDPLFAGQRIINGIPASQFYHTQKGIAFQTYDVIHGSNISENNNNLVSNISFNPFSDLPYKQNDWSYGKWYYICDCKGTNSSRDSGIYLTITHHEWENRPDYYYSGGFYPNFDDKFESEPDLFGFWGATVPYVYDPINGVQGIPQVTEGTHNIILSRGWISDILSPIRSFVDIDGTQNIIEDEKDTADTPQDSSGTECSVEIQLGEITTRTCQIPTDDMDWDGILDTEDDDQDGDGRLDVSELSDSIQNGDPDTMDMSVISTPYSGTAHSLVLNSANGALEISFEYKVNIVEFGTHLPLVAYVNEDGTQKNPEDYTMTLSTSSQLDRLEDQMCYSPNLGELIYSFPRFPLWLENLTIDSTINNQPVECSWVERRSIDLMSIMMVSSDMEIANWKETIRYTISLTDTGQFSNNIEAKLPSHQGTQGKAWEVILNHGTVTQSDFAYPWNENLSITIPSPPSAENQDQESQQPSIIPTYTSGWSFIADVSQGQIDCSGYSSTVTDNLDDLYQQNDIEYNSLTGYHEYRITDDYVSISCSGSLEFEEAMDGDEIEFCIYLFLDGEREDSGCDTGTFVAKSVNGQRQTVDEVIDDFNQDLDDLEQQWQNDLDDLFSTPESSASSSSDDVSFDDFFILLIVAALIGGIAQSIQKKNKEKATSKKKHSSKRNRKKAFDSQPSSYVESEVLQPNQEIVEEESYDTTEFHDSAYDSEYLETETASEDINAVGEVSYNQPPFSFSGEIDEHGWEVCEYPRSSGIWWWKDYEAEQWVLWE